MAATCHAHSCESDAHCVTGTAALKAKYGAIFYANVQNQRGALGIVHNRVSVCMCPVLRAAACRSCHVTAASKLCVDLTHVLFLVQLLVPYGGLAGDCGNYRG